MGAAERENLRSDRIAEPGACLGHAVQHGRHVSLSNSGNVSHNPGWKNCHATR